MNSKFYFVSINICYRDNEYSNIVLLNENSYPIIYWWNTGEDLLDCIKDDEKFKKIIFDKCINKKLYDKSFLSIFYYDTDIDEYIEKIINIQDFYSIINISLIDPENDFYYEYVLPIFEELFTNVYKITYDQYNSDGTYDIQLSNESRIADIYQRIIHGVKREITLETVLNYIRKQLLDNTKLTKENIDIIINKLNNLLKEV